MKKIKKRLIYSKNQVRKEQEKDSLASIRPTLSGPTPEDDDNYSIYGTNMIIVILSSGKVLINGVSITLYL